MPSSARSRPAATPNRQVRGPTPLPVYEPPQHPLNETAQRALQDLPRNHKLDSLKAKLRVANNRLTQAAADVNDRYSIKNAEQEKRRIRREKQGSQESNEDEDRMLNAMKNDTDKMTHNLEASVRRIIDASAEVEGVEKALRELNANVASNRGNVAPTQSTLGASQFRQKRRRRDADLDDEDSEVEDDTTQTDGDRGVIEVLKSKIAEQRSAYQNSSMADRYASHNDYVGFRKIVHDAHYPEDQPPPMPNASTWFPSESSQSSALENRGATAGNQPADDDDDLAVASERISIKCPITLLPMKDPVTSQKCPHSFEKAAILSMINASDVFVGGSGRRGVHDGQKAMKCPVCEVLLTANDVKENPVLVRKIKRIQAAVNAQNEESSDEETSRRGRPSLFGSNNSHEEVSSSPITTRTPRLKSERQSQAATAQSREVSMVPNSQVQELTREEGRPSSSAATDVVDLEESDEDIDE